MENFKNLEIENSALKDVTFRYKFEYRSSDGPEPALWLHISINQSLKAKIHYILYRSNWEAENAVVSTEQLQEGAEKENPAHIYMLECAKKDIENRQNIELTDPEEEKYFV